MKFTDKFIKGLEAKDSAYRIFEKGGDKGFGVKITPAGSKSFFIQYATLVRSKIDDGIDPQSEDEHSLGSVKELFHYYIGTMKANGKRTWHEVERDLNLNCQSILSLQAKDIQPLHNQKDFVHAH